MDFPCLQMEAKLSAGAKEMGETQGSVASNATRSDASVARNKIPRKR